MLVQAIPNGIVANTQALYMYPVMEVKGFTLSQFSLIFTIGMIVPAIIGPFIGSLYGKLNTKIFYLVGGILLSGGFMTFSIAEQLWQFYAIAAVAQIGSSIVSGIGIPMLLNSWFDENTKGKAMGMAFAGGSIGNYILTTVSYKNYKFKWICSLIFCIWFSRFSSNNTNSIIYGKNAEK